MTLAEIAAAVGGVVHDGDPATMVTAPVRFDTRLLEPGGMFAAFAGEHVDGQTLAAVAAGAVGVLAARPVGACRRWSSTTSGPRTGSWPARSPPSCLT